MCLIESGSIAPFLGGKVALLFSSTEETWASSSCGVTPLPTFPLQLFEGMASAASEVVSQVLPLSQQLSVPYSCPLTAGPCFQVSLVVFLFKPLEASYGWL